MCFFLHLNLLFLMAIFLSSKFDVQFRTRVTSGCFIIPLFVSGLQSESMVLESAENVNNGNPSPLEALLAGAEGFPPMLDIPPDADDETMVELAIALSLQQDQQGELCQKPSEFHLGCFATGQWYLVLRFFYPFSPSVILQEAAAVVLASRVWVSQDRRPAPPPWMQELSLTPLHQVNGAQQGPPLSVLF